MRKLLSTLILGTALTAPVIVVGQEPVRDAERREAARRYYDRHGKDYHNWNGTEDRAYRYWLDQHHRPYHAWDGANAREQQAYWNWRHAHDDAWIQVNIH